uniref:Uncharacterized protein n=1 Tax=Magallana gigas TaxID=29159 RepID=K1QX55_MAGGI
MKEEAEVYEKVHRAMVTEEVTEKRGGLAFGLTFFSLPCIQTTMDPRSSAKDVPRCDLCETDIVQNYCDFCHANLCTPCVGKHISDGYDKHKIVPFQKRGSTLIYPK